MSIFDWFRKPAKPRPDPMIEVDAALTAPGFDKAAFFAVLRGTALRHQRPAQVDGTEMLLDKLTGLPAAWVAYALATTWHETAATMQPIHEHGNPAYFKRMYDPEGPRPHVARALGNTLPGDGVRFAGRGYVQLTGRTNYDRAAKATGYPLVGNPDLAMRPDIAAEILRAGMIEGWFTGRKFASALPGSPASRAQFREARRIINGTDRAEKIASYALNFQAALIAGGWK
ncbi:MAG: glycoside hydrolase family 19 protein [Rhabdaerophilum sp.]